MKFNYLRIFAVESDQPPLLVATGDIEARLPRDKYLLKVFGEHIAFRHYNREFRFVPIAVDRVAGGSIIYARVGAQKTMHINSGPSDNLEPIDTTAWLAANFFLDTRDFNDGQKVAMQNRVEVGKPLSVMSSLISHINEKNNDSGWQLEVNNIISKRSFWEAAKTYKGQITKAEFHYVTPNVLGLRSALNATLKQYRDNEKAQRVTVQIENDGGSLELEDSQRVHDAVEYIAKGGGSTKLKAGKETVYDSENDETSVTLDTDNETEVENKDKRESFLGRLFK